MKQKKSILALVMIVALLFLLDLFLSLPRTEHKYCLRDAHCPTEYVTTMIYPPRGSTAIERECVLFRCEIVED